MDRPSEDEFHEAIHFLEVSGDEKCLKVAAYLLKQMALRKARMEMEEQLEAMSRAAEKNPTLKLLLDSIFKRTER